MQTQFENPEAIKLNNVTASSASPRMRIICVAEKTAEKSTEAGQHSGTGYNKLVSKYLTSRGLQSHL
jgi:hypothetical protein